jgi:alpha-L-arabinofuranosidase
VVLASAPGRVDLDMVSLFPEHTWKDRPNGLRADLVRMLADLHPAFLRFPGGCIVEGMDLANSYRWKDTIGDVAERPENWNRWQSAIKTAPAPQYYQTDGLGFFEYFQLCEDIGAEPVPILNCGMACQYQSAQLVPLDRLDPFVRDMLDLIEFANGPASSPWGSRRAALGHPAPFHLKYLGVGNEQWGEQYFERYRIFYAAIKAKYPDIRLVTTSGPGVDDPRWALAWGKFRTGTPADIVDEHAYHAPDWFIGHSTRYDHYDRAGPRVFVGEFAAHDGFVKRNTLRAAVAEAAFLTGLVRNSDVVAMSSYAPLLARVGATQWQPDLIWFDNTRVYGSPSYYVQELFSRNRPDIVLPVDIASGVPAAANEPPPLFAVAGRDDRAGDIVVFVANPYGRGKSAHLAIRGARQLVPEATATILTSASPDDENSLDAPAKVAPRVEILHLAGLDVARTYPAYSLTVLRLKAVLSR